MRWAAEITNTPEMVLIISRCAANAFSRVHVMNVKDVKTLDADIIEIYTSAL
jgi:hypothetical protein